MDEERWMTYAAAALRTTMKWSVRGEPTDEALRAMRIGWACEYGVDLIVTSRRAEFRDVAAC